jgi:HD-GYP domain-containing protein (c-di-GMP phosphodiesterase class II)
MLPNPKDPQTDLWFTEKGSILDVSADVLTWGKQWVQRLAKQNGISQVWIALVEENFPNRRITNLSSDPLPVQFSAEILQGVVERAQVFTISDHVELVSGGLFPLVYHERVIGLMGLMSNQTDYFKPGTIAWIGTLTQALSDSLFQKEYGSEDRQAEFAISSMLQATLDVRDALATVLEILAGMLKADAVTALRYYPNSRHFGLLGTYGLESADLARLTLQFEAGLVGNSYENRLLWIEDLLEASSNVRPINRLEEEGFRGYLALPLIAHNDQVGALEFAWRLPRYTQTWNKEFLERAANQIALAMERTFIIQDLRQNNIELTDRYNALVEGLSRALELRDLETEGHTRRVSLLTMRLVERMQIPPGQWHAIQQGALMHDIGKIGIPDAILLKPGSLNARERKVMQQHVLYGYNILAPIISARHTLDIILYHHEHWNGKGYPYGLKGEQIPLVARLFAMVDVFDALTSDRPYRTAWSRAQTLEYLREQSGFQFDPQVVKHFLEIADERG